MNWNDQKDNRYIFTVSELNNSAKKTLENSFSDIWIKGEISNFKSYPSGHWYFTLKDEESQIQCVMFKFKNSLLNFCLATKLVYAVTVYVVGSIGLLKSTFTPSADDV